MQKHTRRKLQASLFIFEPKTWQHKALFWLHYHTFEYICSTDVTLSAFRSVTPRVISDEVVISSIPGKSLKAPLICAQTLYYLIGCTYVKLLWNSNKITQRHHLVSKSFLVYWSLLYIHKVSACSDVVSHFWVQILQNSKILLRVKNTSDLLISNKIINLAVWLGITIKSNNKKQ